MNDMDETYRQRWKDLPIKDRIAYIFSFVLTASGIIMGYLSFFLTEHNDINTGVLIYIAQTFLISGSILGISAYFKTKFVEFSTDTKTQLQAEIEKLLNKGEEEPKE